MQKNPCCESTATEFLQTELTKRHRQSMHDYRSTVTSASKYPAAWPMARPAHPQYGAGFRSFGPVEHHDIQPAVSVNIPEAALPVVG
jgi:hypothetical protein